MKKNEEKNTTKQKQKPSSVHNAKKKYKIKPNFQDI